MFRMYHQQLILTNKALMNIVVIEERLCATVCVLDATNPNLNCNFFRLKLLFNNIVHIRSLSLETYLYFKYFILHLPSHA